MTEPIFLQGICKDYLWGGNRLREEYGKQSDADKIAESWELACHKDGSSILKSGPDAGKTLREYLDAHGPAFLGTNCAGCTTVPVLIKLIDAKQDLSIQVHPDDAYAMRTEGEPGKTEMWYIVDAAPGAALYYGLNRTVTKEEFAQRIEAQTLPEILNRVEVKPGELYFIPSGTLHAIGAGILLAEIQQNSNTTYRIYDYGRVGKDGKPRELHVEKAKEVTNLVPPKYPTTAQGAPTAIEGGKETLLRSCEYFNVNKLELDGTTKLTAGEGSFNSLLVLDGAFEIAAGSEKAAAKKGDSLFITAGTGEYTVTGKGTIILTDII